MSSGVAVRGNLFAKSGNSSSQLSMSAVELGTEPSRPRSRRSPSYCLQLKRAKSGVSKLSAMLGSDTHMELADNLAVRM